jgi:excisionase family DNA binding protein
MPNLKPLLSVDEAAILLGASRASIYRSIERGDLPLPVFKINGRLRIARQAVERLLAGEPPLDREEGAVKGGGDGEQSERTLDGPAPSPHASHDRNGRPPCGRPECPGFVQSNKAATCSAARRSSSGTPSV